MNKSDLRKQYRSTKIPTYWYIKLVRLKALLQLKRGKKAGFAEVFEYLFDHLPEETKKLLKEAEEK